MKHKRFLAAVLLGVVLCFVVSGAGLGEEMTTKQVREAAVAQKASQIDLILLGSEVKYIRNNPNDFLDISCSYNHFEITSIEGYSHKDWGLP